jgi:hypothetical protein
LINLLYEETLRKVLCILGHTLFNEILCKSLTKN